jgi:hypothetical protein
VLAAHHPDGMSSIRRRPRTVAVVKLLLLSAVGVALVVVAAAAAAPPPEELLGTWTRTVSAADVNRAHSTRIIPGTKWTLVIGRHTSSVRSSGGKTFKGTIVPTSATLVNIELGAKTNLYGWRRAGKTVIFTLNHDPNPDRVAILVGTWKRR